MSREDRFEWTGGMFVTHLPSHNVAAEMQTGHKLPAGDMQAARDYINVYKADDDECKSKYTDKKGDFRDGFDGCVKWAKDCKGLDEERAQALCAYIGRRAGKI